MSFRHQLPILFLSGLVILGSGCAHTRHVLDLQPLTVGPYPPVAKSDLKIELRITDDLRKAQCEWELAGETWQLLLGSQFALNSEALARHLFADVIVKNSADAPPDAGTDAVLVPRLVTVDRAAGMSAFSESKISAALEWSLKSAKGDIVWIDTIKGEAKNKTGTLFVYKEHMREGARMMLTDLFNKSFQAMSASPEIRDFAALRKK